ncbi:hypothetical protein ACO0K0_15255 [Undibacterium sp. SXout11W]|uniref:hypothetical protein n=1 Tax=Undibacterium sp. SXout11W TaxID=3413050 RepID=UPI003BEFB58C
MNNTFTSFSTAILRKMFMLGTIVIAMSLTGCAAVAPKYQATVDNAKTLQATQGGVASVGPFTAKNANLNQLSLRGGAYTSPYNNSYAEYLKEALRVELESAGKLGNNTNVVITGELLKNSLDAAIGTGTANVSARFVVTRDKNKSYDKVLSADTQWESSFVGAIAIPAARQHYADAVKQLLGKLFEDKDFQQSIK